MSRTYYQQPTWSAPQPTMTVGQLIHQLQNFDPALPAIFRSPLSGCYRPQTGYSIDIVKRETLEGREEHTPAGVRFNEETGEEEPYEAWTDHFPAWDGVVIA